MRIRFVALTIHTFIIPLEPNFFSIIVVFCVSKMAAAIKRWKFLQGSPVQITSHNLPTNRKDNLTYWMEGSDKFFIFYLRGFQHRGGGPPLLSPNTFFF